MFGDFRADHDDTRAGAHFLICEGSADGHREILDVEIVRIGRDRLHLTWAGTRSRRVLERFARDAGLHRGGNRRTHGFDVGHSDQRPSLCRTGVEAAISPGADIVESSQREGVAADQARGKIFFDVAPHPFNDGDHGNEEHDANGHPQQGEGALEFLNSNLGQCQTDRVACFHVGLNDSHCRSGR